MRIARSKSQTFCAAAIATLLLCAPTVFGALQENCNTIEAAFTLADGDKTYFLSGGEYIEYSLYRESEAKVGPITALGLTRRANHPDAAFTLTNDILVILKECKYFKYSRQDNGRLALREEGNNFGGLPCSPDAAISLTDETLVFKDCSVWKFSNTTQSFQPDGGLAERGLPCHLDAAVRWKSQQTIFIKSTSFWKSAHEITGPYHTDDLNLCSWYLCGEADWMTQRNRGRLECNGDKRFCQLRLNQVTLPGLHNAGAGFDGGLFYGVDCWVRNHARSILQQLQLGIRYLDIDSSYHRCSVLGSNHNSLCGGSICRMLKQTRKFLSENPHEVIALTFNHEMQDVDLVIPALTRQLKSQLGPMLNNKFRLWREQRWPKLRQAVRTNKRVFVFYTPAVQNEPYGNRFYRRKKWIHSESWVGSTWREFTVNDGNCSEIVALTADRCRVRQYRELVEISVVPTPYFGSPCINHLAQQCRPFHHEMLRVCEPHRYRHNDSPNVLLVDYPEVDPDSPSSVFTAVFHQNVRNVHKHRREQCQVRVDAAVRRPSQDDESLFFVGSKIIVFSHSSRVQTREIEVPGVTAVEAAYISGESQITVIKGCESLRLNSTSLQPLDSDWTRISSSCDASLDAAESRDGTLYVFRGCYVIAEGQTPKHLSSLGLPCDVDAALNFGGETFVFKYSHFWIRREGEVNFSHAGHTLEWTIDAVVCS